MVQKAMARREANGEHLLKIGSTVTTTRRNTAVRRRAPMIEVTQETSDGEQMMTEIAD